MTQFFAEYETNKMYQAICATSFSSTKLDSFSRKAERFYSEYEVGSDVLCRIAHLKDTPENVLERLADLKDPNISSYIARRDIISDKLFDLIINSGGMILYHLAGNSNLSKEREARLLQGGHRVRSRIANLTRNPETQLTLAKDSRSDVRHHLALNYHLSKEAQEILMEDDNTEVRYALANSTCTHIDVLTYMKENDSHYEVKRCARNRVNTSNSRPF